MGFLLDNLKVFLGDEMSIGIQTKFIPSWSWKDEIGNIHAEVVGGQTAWYVNWREGAFADDLVLIKEHELDFKCVLAFGIRERKIDADLWMLTGKRLGPEVCKCSNDAFFPGQAIDDNGVTH